MMSNYHSSFIKKIVDYYSLILIILFLTPLIAVVLCVAGLLSGFKVLFIQKRVGIDGKIFRMIKFRTMELNAEKSKFKYLKLNQADGPVFKIHDDPRFTKIGKILSRSGMDELPQFFNILKGEMSLVGPRPLPVDEADKLTKNQKIREMVKPGIISTWVTHGSHKLNFRQWMKLDKEYVENATFLTDLKVIKDSAVLITKNIINIFS